jgi:hypothetical protein
MGQDFSRDAQDTSDISKPSDYSEVANSIWTPMALDAFVRKVKRADGSSVKELYIPSWRVTFFRNGGTMELVDNCDDCTSGSGTYAKIDVDSALLLYNAWSKYKEAKYAVAAASSVFSKYADNSVKF